MIKNFSKKSILKLLILNLIFLLVVFIFNLFFQYNLIREFKNKSIMSYQSVVASLVDRYPNDEVEIVKPIINLSDENLAKKGEKILNKYGYNNSMESFLDVSLSDEIRSVVWGNSIYFLVILFSIISLAILSWEYIKKYIIVANNFLESFLKKDFSYSNDVIYEGHLGILVNNFNRLGKFLKLEIIKLENEKENSKEVVTDLGHQIKTPLATLSLYNSILQDDDLSSEEKEDFFNENNKAIFKLESLFDSLINVSKLEKEMIQINLSNSNIKNTLIKAVNSVYLKAEKKGININLNNIGDYTISHDKKWTEEALINILDNAIKYNKTNGEINISFEEGISYFKINISDTGIGIKESDYNKIFKRFYRGTDKDIENIEGSGVGLYLARKVLEFQGGNIIVKSKINKGSKFSLFLQNCK